MYEYNSCSTYFINYVMNDNDFNKNLFNKKNLFRIEKILQEDLMVKLEEHGYDNVSISTYSFYKFEYPTGIVTFEIDCTPMIREFIESISSIDPNDSSLKISNRSFFSNCVKILKNEFL